MAALVARNQTATMVGVVECIDNGKSSHAATLNNVCRASVN
jgi:hypothetical protein